MTADNSITSNLQHQDLLPLDAPTQAFIAEHRHEDVRRLAFLGSKMPQVNMPFALDQIAGWQAARRKLPTWAATEGLLFPPHLSMEQCSSETTARYKADLVARLMPEAAGKGRLIDLTGGFGVDFSYMAPRFAEAVYVERNAPLCAVARHNLAQLGLTHATVVCGDGVDYLHHLPTAHAAVPTCIYLDPARRNAQGGRVVSMADCTPDVLSLYQELLAKATLVIVKLSPMLDHHQAVAQLGGVGYVAEVHIVSVDNECRELLLVLRQSPLQPIEYHCVGNRYHIAFLEASSRPSICHTYEGNMPHLAFLYEPDAALMKAGCFGMLCERYGVRALAENSHLFVSDHRVPNFPGRSFAIEAFCSMNKRELRTTLAGVKQANIATRNSPMTAEGLRKRLKLRDGGDLYIFATTLQDGAHTLIMCKKTS